jgi:hypothetical protein
MLATETDAPAIASVVTYFSTAASLSAQQALLLSDQLHSVDTLKTLQAFQASNIDIAHVKAVFRILDLAKAPKTRRLVAPTILRCDTSPASRLHLRKARMSLTRSADPLLAQYENALAMPVLLARQDEDTDAHTDVSTETLPARPDSAEEMDAIETRLTKANARITLPCIEHVERLAPLVDWTITALAQRYGVRRDTVARYFSGYGQHSSKRLKENRYNLFLQSKDPRVKQIKIERERLCSASGPLTLRCRRAWLGQRRSRWKHGQGLG